MCRSWRSRSCRVRSKTATTSARNSPTCAKSGSIEQDADVVLFVFREEYYLSNKEPRPGTDEHIKWQTEMDAAHGKAEIIIGKQRHGPTGTVSLQFDAAVTRFDNLARDADVPDQIPDRF